MKIELFIPCFVDQIYPETGFNMVKLLKKAGCEVSYNDKQTCCGQPAYNNGFMDEARDLAIKFVDDFNVSRPIVSPGGSCTGFIKKHYPSLLDQTIHSSRCERVVNNVFEISDFLVNHLKITSFGSRLIGKVTIHDSCSAKREYGLKDEVRTLLRNVEGLDIVEMEKCDDCCGFGGTFSVKQTAISTAMVAQKVENAMKTGATVICTTESSCLMNLDGYIKKNKLPIKAMHIVDILASGIDE